MRVVGLLVVLLIVAGVFEFGGRKLDKQQVLDFYRVMEAAQRNSDDQALCDLLADTFHQKTRVRGGRADVPDYMDKGDYCIAMAQQYSLQRAMPANVRAFSTQVWLDGVTLADDRRSAVMHLRSLQVIPGRQVRARYDLQVERRRWRMRVLRSEGVVSVGS